MLLRTIELAAKYLLCTWMASRVDFNLCKDLLISLHLNLAACTLKQGSFQRAFNLCFLVTNINPECIKARFRRAKASLEIDFTTIDLDYLKIAMSLDPTDIEVFSELGKVELLLKSYLKGKRKLDSFDPQSGSSDFWAIKPTLHCSSYML